MKVSLRPQPFVDRFLRGNPSPTCRFPSTHVHGCARINGIPIADTRRAIRRKERLPAPASASLWMMEPVRPVKSKKSWEQDRAHSAIFIVAAGFHLFRSAVGAYSENGDNCQMQLR